MSYRSAAVRATVKEWQSHPEGRPALYWSQVLDPPDPTYRGDWCGGFVLRNLKQAGLAKHTPWIIGEGFIWPSRLPRVAEPQPGDVLVVPDPFEHQAMVISYEPTTRMVTSIDGNTPGIKPVVRFVGNGNIEFYSIQPFVDEAEAEAPAWPFLVAGVALAGAGAWVWLNGLPGPIDRVIKRLRA